MFPPTPSGFAGAPVSLLVLSLTTLVSLLASSLQLRSLISLNLSNFRFNGFISFFGWPLYIFNCVSMKEFICAGILLYQSRYLERLGGPKKYLGMIGILGFSTTVILLSLLVIAPTIGSSSDPDIYDVNGPEGFVGPSSLIFALLTVMTSEVPSIHHFSILGLPLSERLFSFLLALQLLLTRSTASFLQALVGTLIGYAYVKNMFGLADFRFPSFFSSPILTLGSLFSNVKPANPNSRPSVPLVNPVRSPAVPAVVPQAARVVAPAQQQGAVPRRPDDPRITQLMAMGFECRDVITALELTNLDVDMALNILLDDQRRRQ